MTRKTRIAGGKSTGSQTIRASAQKIAVSQVAEGRAPLIVRPLMKPGAAGVAAPVPDVALGGIQPPEDTRQKQQDEHQADEHAAAPASPNPESAVEAGAAGCSREAWALTSCSEAERPPRSAAMPRCPPGTHPPTRPARRRSGGESAVWHRRELYDLETHQLEQRRPRVLGRGLRVAHGVSSEDRSSPSTYSIDT